MTLPQVRLRLSQDDPFRCHPRFGSKSGLGFRRSFCELARAYQERGGARTRKSVNETFQDLSMAPVTHRHLSSVRLTRSLVISLTGAISTISDTCAANTVTQYVALASYVQRVNGRCRLISLQPSPRGSAPSLPAATSLHMTRITPSQASTTSSSPLITLMSQILLKSSRSKNACSASS